MSREKELLEESKVFCILPWVNMHLWPNGDAFPCGGINKKIGNIAESSITEVANNDTMKELRRNMLAGKPSSLCGECYLREKSAGGGNGSLRCYANRGMGKASLKEVEQTKADGGLPSIRFKFMDFRFSNLCNLRCRTCGPELSSGWYADHRLLNPEAETPTKVLKLFSSDKQLFKSIEPHLDTLEEIYFAGGEPLIIDEHYKVLEWLIKHGKFNIRLTYNTNLSMLTHGKWNVLDLWNRFKTVNVWASLDATGDRAEYIRKGTHWKNMRANALMIRAVCPHVTFSAAPAVGVLNAFHLPDFHKSLVKDFGLDPNCFRINPVFYPTYYRIQVLTPEFKSRLKDLYLRHITDYLIPLKAELPIAGFKGLINLLEQEDRSGELPLLSKVTRKLDEIRGESFEKTLPELVGLGI